MASFLQLHLLTSYPPSNLNRDDMGSPKSAIVGGTNRIRISSQSLKRAWRVSDVFASRALLTKGTRTKIIAQNHIIQPLQEAGFSAKEALEIAKLIIKPFGDFSTEKGKEKDLKTITFFTPEEIQAIDAIVAEVAKTKQKPDEKTLSIIRDKTSAIDVALFGRMLAGNQKYNFEAAAQVAHAFTVHSAVVQDDYFTAVDDLNKSSLEEKSGSAHLDTREFAAGLYYLYICVNVDLLRENLAVAADSAQTADIAKRALRGLTEAAVSIAPTGMQNSFASRARASFVLAEIGSEQPRSLSVAFLKAVKGDDILGQAITSLTTIQSNMDSVYGACADKRYTLDTTKPEGTLKDLLTFVEGA